MFRPSAIVVLAFLLLAPFANFAAAGIKVTQKSRFYRVSGHSIQDVVRSMKQNGPYSWDHGRRALTDLQVKDCRCAAEGHRAKAVQFDQPSARREARVGRPVPGAGDQGVRRGGDAGRGEAHVSFHIQKLHSTQDITRHKGAVGETRVPTNRQ